MPTQSQKYMNFNEIATKFLEFYDASMTREYGNYLNAKEFARLVLVGGRQEIEKNIAEYRNDIKSIKNPAGRELFNQLVNAITDGSPEGREFISNANEISSTLSAGYEIAQIYMRKLFTDIRDGKMQNPHLAYIYLKMTKEKTRSPELSNAVFDAIVNHEMATMEDFCDYINFLRGRDGSYAVQMDLLYRAKEKMEQDIAKVKSNPENIDSFKADLQRLDRTVNVLIGDYGAKPEQQQALVRFRDEIRRDFDPDKIMLSKNVDYFETRNKHKEIEFQERQQELQRQIEQLTQQLRAEQQKNQDLTRKSENLTQENERLTAKVTDLQQRLGTAEREKQDAQNNLNRILRLMDAKMGIMKMYLKNMIAAANKSFGRGKELSELGIQFSHDMALGDLEFEIQQIKQQAVLKQLQLENKGQPRI